MNEIKLTGESKDIVSENISKLKKLFPEVVTEDKIDFKKLELILGEDIDDSNEKYSFIWPGKTQAIKESQKQSSGTLRPVPDESRNWDTTQNLYIEGDNLEVLKLLQKSFYNKIKCIYIDPPYNTGRDFVYPDNYKDNLSNYLKITGQISDEDEIHKLSTNIESSGRYHSNWLNMMYPRLKLARNLLSDDGIIFISIDDNEFENLKKLCDEIFGESMHTATIHRRKNRKPHNAGKTMSLSHEFILVYYKKNIFKLAQEFSNLKKDDKGDFTIYPVLQGDKKERIYTFKAGIKCEKSDLKKGIIKASRNEKLNIEILDDPIVENNILMNDIKIKGRYRLTNESGKLDAAMDAGNIFINSTGFPKEKRYRKDSDYKIDNHYWDIEKGKNEDGDDEIKKLFEITGDNYIFSYPKPVALLKKIFSTLYDNNNNSIIMDFFSGSATTADAMFQYNLENKDNKRFILVQIPEPIDESSDAYPDYKNICEIGKERIRRAGDNIIGKSGNNEIDIGFKVFKLDSSNLEKWDPDYNNIQESLIIDNIKEERTNEDLVYEIMLKYGIDLTLPIEKYDNIYSIGFGALVICLDNNINKEIANEIIKLTKNSSTSRVVFKDSGFASDADKTNIKEILKSNHIDEFITI